MPRISDKNDLKEKILPVLVENNLFKEYKKIKSMPEWISFSKAYKSLYDASIRSNLPFDPRFNSIHWALDVAGLINEILFSYCWMAAFAGYYRAKIKADSKPGHSYFPVSYFADNCITRIYSCRDKIALMVWAFYVPFNPELQVLDYKEVVRRLKNPIKYGLIIKNQEYFLKGLGIVNGSDFNQIEQYRHIKTHRREPRVEIYGVKSYHGWPYLIPVESPSDIDEFEKKLEKDYPDHQHREIIKKSCYKKEILFNSRTIKNHLWDFDKVQAFIKTSLIKLLKASDCCFRVLRRRVPLRAPVNGGIK